MKRSDDFVPPAGVFQDQRKRAGVRAFAALLERLALTPARKGKLRLLVDYFGSVQDPDRGMALAALTGDLDLPSVKPALLRELVTGRVDAELFALSYDYVGDLAETISLIWEPRGPMADVRLCDVVERLSRTRRGQAGPVVEALLDGLGTSERYALVKLATGGLRVGVSARLAKQALADFGALDVAEIEELWHGLSPPYAEVFAWAEARGPKPEQTAPAPFRPVMLASALDEAALPDMDPAAFFAEWKWDGIRVQAVAQVVLQRKLKRK